MRSKALILLPLLALGLAANASAQKFSAPGSWPAEVRKAYQAVLAAPAGQPGKSREASAAFLALAHLGPAAHDALGTLAFNGALPESHRAFSGIWFGQFYRFEPEALKRLAKVANPFLQRQAIEFLADQGGKAATEFLTALAKEQPVLARTISLRLPKMSAQGRSAHVLGQLDILLRSAEKQAKARAAAALAETKGEDVEWGLARLTSAEMSNISDADTQIFAALARCRLHEKEPARLEGLCQRGNPKFLRLEAMKALAKSAAGKAALKRCVLGDDDPMKPERDRLAR